MDDLFEFSLKTIMAGALITLIMFVGWTMAVNDTLNKYCTAQQGIYERIDDVNYCVVDNQLFAIEWSE